MDSVRENKEKDDERSASVFENLDKSTLLEETKYFNAIPIDSGKCSHVLTKILYFLNQGEELTTDEATKIFFATTKLFQSKDVKLRRLLYLCIKELSSMAQDVIVVCSSLTKDVAGKEDFHRAAAIRALGCITDNTMMQSIERYMKQAIVDEDPEVNSAALVSALHLTERDPELVGRWVNEAQDAIMSYNAMVSYHALGLAAEVKSNDNQATARLVTKFVKSPLRSPYALGLLIRHAAKLADEEETESSQPYLEFIESCLRHKSEIVIYEAAYAMVNLKKPPKDISQAVNLLQTFCNSSKSVFRLAGARTLANLVIKHPMTVTECGVDLENLISDPNPSIATLAVTTLLTAGPESSINRLMALVVGFLPEIPDEVKIMVVEAIKGICSKFPQKHRALSAFLAVMLVENGGKPYKAAIAETLILLIEENPDARDSALANLCEFIEDCDNSNLIIRILHVLGREGPKAREPSSYVRYIYNRILLNVESVRAAAVTTLATFGAKCEGLSPDIKILLTRCHSDDDDEVRDRAIFFSQILGSGDRQLINDYIVNIRVPNFVLLEKYIREYLTTPLDEPFDIFTVPANDSSCESKENESQTIMKQVVSREELYADQLKFLPGIEKLGRLFKTCMPLDLTEPETEYRVTLVKHVFRRHLVLQFECLNTLNNQFLEKVYINLAMANYYAGLTDVACESLPYGKQGSVFCLLEFPEVPIETLCSMKAMMEFIVRECNPATGEPDLAEGYADSYILDKVVIGMPEQFRNRAASDDWEEVWIRARRASEVTDRFSLPRTNIMEGAKAVCQQVGLPNTAITGEDIKEIKGGGIFREGTPMLIRAMLEDIGGDVTMFFSCRSPRVDLATLVVGAVAS